MTATFAAAWPKGGDPPAGEPAGTRGGRGGLEVGVGRSRPVAEKSDPVGRQVGRTRGNVSVLYQAKP